MSERSIRFASRAGLALVLAATLALAGAVALLAGCTTTTPPVVVTPGPPTPEPTPAATCETACDRALELRCTSDADLCAETCRRYAALGGDSAWDVACAERAESCGAFEACRGGQ